MADAQNLENVICPYLLRGKLFSQIASSTEKS